MACGRSTRGRLHCVVSAGRPERHVATPEPVHARSRQGRRLLPGFRDQHCHRGRDRDHPSHRWPDCGDCACRRGMDHLAPSSARPTHGGNSRRTRLPLRLDRPGARTARHRFHRPQPLRVRRRGADRAVRIRRTTASVRGTTMAATSTGWPGARCRHCGRREPDGVVPAVPTCSAVHAGLTRAYVALVQQYEGATWIDPDHRPPGMPAPIELLALTRRFGSPTADAFLSAAAPPAGPTERERALIMLVGDAFRVIPGPPPCRPTRPDNDPGRRRCRDDGRGLRDGGTQRKRSSIEILARSDSWIEVTLPDGGTGDARIGHTLPPASRTRKEFAAHPGQACPCTCPRSATARTGASASGCARRPPVSARGRPDRVRYAASGRLSSPGLNASSRNGDGTSGSYRSVRVRRARVHAT